MIRNLHLTFVDGAAGAPRRLRRVRRGRGGAGGWNPEEEVVVLEPDNPEEEIVVLDPDNPEEEVVILDPDNPEEEVVVLDPDNPDGRYGYGGAAGAPLYLSAVATGAHGCGCSPAPCGCGCKEEAKRASGPCPGVRPGDYSGFVIVRLDRGVPLSAKDQRSGAEVFPESLWALADELGLDALRAVLEMTGEEAPTDGDGEGGAGAAAAASGRRPLALGRRRRRDRDERRKEHGDGGDGGNGGDGGDGGNDEEPFEPRPRPPGTLVSRPLIDIRGYAEPGTAPFTPSWAETLGKIRRLEGLRRVATGPFKPLHSLGRYWRVDLRPYPDRAEEVVERLNELAEVDLAYRELTASDPNGGAADGQSFAEDQGYLDDAPVGVGARWAWAEANRLEGAGAGAVQVCDLEQQWRPAHVGLAGVDSEPLYGVNRDADDEEDGPGNHGNAVLGQLAATGNLSGAAHSIGRFLLASHYWSRNLSEHDPRYPFRGTNGHVAAAIFNALLGMADEDGKQQQSQTPQERTLRAGDVLLIEVQRGRLPCEIDAADFDAIRLASALGVVVVEAAGNGGVDLDACVNLPDGRSLRRGSGNFRDSGAILVGAAWSRLPHDRAPFSNHGSRLDCFAWGDSVTSCGYGDLAGEGYDDYYTNTFSGTSSAAPVVAGAAALVQYLHAGSGAGTLGPKQMRALLSNPRTGTRQGPNVGGHIGVMPNLKAIVGGELQLVPDVYLRRHVGDDGETPGKGESISSSPDVGVGSKPSGEGDDANRPAPGDPLDSASSLWVRLRNRGSGEGKVDVTLFASPAATLVTPERWWVVGREAAVEVGQGDLLTSRQVTASQPPDWLSSSAPLPAEWPAEPPLALLAVVRPHEDGGSSPGYTPPVQPESLLPPGPPAFDWGEYRSFLRGQGVAWRNAHRAQAGALPFLVAGTPDRTRHFDFEVIQRLPAGAEVTWTVPQALAAKLKQSQPLLQGGTVLTLPRRPRTRIQRVCLSAGHCAPARFEVTGAPLATGHSLAIRQLWRGEEVGRITWYFE